MLAVDLEIDDKNSGVSPRRFRLCTAQLESLSSGENHRIAQLTAITRLIKPQPAPEYQIVGGILGGDLNSLDVSEHRWHQLKQVNLSDVWKDG